MSLQDEINKWAKSAAGKKKIDDAKKEAEESGRQFGGSTRSKLPSYYSQRLIDYLDQEISAAGFRFGEYLYQVDVGYNSKEQKYELHVNFKPEEIGRPSLDPDTYRDGAYDIVALMNHGYHAPHVVRGKWHERDTKSLKDRNGAYFIESAINLFNAHYADEAYAEADGKY